MHPKTSEMQESCRWRAAAQAEAACFATLRPLMDGCRCSLAPALLPLDRLSSACAHVGGVLKAASRQLQVLTDSFSAT